MTTALPIPELKEAISNELKAVGLTIHEAKDKDQELTWGDIKTFAWSSTTFDGLEWELSFSVLANTHNRAIDINTKLMDALHNADFPIEGHSLVDLQFEKTVIRTDNVSLVHFKALTVKD